MESSTNVSSERKGLWWILTLPNLYDSYQELVGATRVRQRLADEFIRVHAADRVLEVGCGTARMLDHLAAARYVGIDHNPQYIADARRRYGNRGEFITGDLAMLSLGVPDCYDIVLAIGVLHHIDDTTATRLFSEASRVLSRGGRMITVDPAFVGGQPLLAKLLVSLDRGRNVRTPERYEALAQSSFPNVRSHVCNLLPHIAYTHCVMECSAQ